MKNNYKRQKGSIAVYAIVTVFTFMLILSAIFYGSAGIRKRQLITMPEIKAAYERYLNNKYEIYEAEVEKRRDKVAPTIEISLSATTAKVGETITVTIKISDNKNRLDYSKCSYACSEANISGELSTEESSISVTFDSAGTYSISVYASDQDKNSASQSSEAITITAD